MHETN